MFFYVLYLIKKDSKGSMRQVAKSLLNDLLGRFGVLALFEKI